MPIENLADCRVLVTGVCGTIGATLVERLLEEHGVSELIGIDNQESALFFLDQRFAAYPNAGFILADIRDNEKMTRIMTEIDVVFHTAAFKHVVMCERSPYEAVQTNIMGVQNVALAASKAGVKAVIFTSSDKAINPTNVMGTSKLMGERLMTAANVSHRGRGTVFASTRFGNVLGSSGSVLPIFTRQIEQGGPVTLTDRDMTRYVMSKRQAVDLIINSVHLARGGEIFITKMPVIRIRDLAEVMISELAPHFGHDPAAIPIEIIGIKPGEKMYEELMSMEETRRALELENYFAVLPAFRGLFSSISYNYPDVMNERVDIPYVSDNVDPLTKDQLTAFLTDNDLLTASGDDGRSPDARYWPGDKETRREGN